mmetsp:Transcript_32998/g.83775  ORF Transcript_32998/g.83775 Transcript_32998/m.83775 type:complete len:101 (+) Transcript_32998:39-341(+)|eukprot:CAMPEP_0183426262 /NCGR_PEP_ID=MMETSP0370-20130417/38787_1 /TAXON_ID=268820 /ORGANISM="Peridinium aciculiferum, Strain PAER-2" /LENGTH=100 /DNA_ID=CAMNT_0025610651 /DNA_START=33 /DNA_END=335 /DNA_ORIENTATION=+
MTRGNQRDKDRLANLKKAEGMAGGNSTIKQAEGTAEIMRQKQLAAEEKRKEAADQGIVLERKGPTQAEKKAVAAMEMAMTGRQATAKAVAGKRASGQKTV